MKYVKCILLGDSDVGKTTLIHRFIDGELNSQFKNTITADFHVKKIDINGETILLQLWDTAGQERFQSIIAAYYRDVDCCALVFDVTSTRSFERVEEWRKEFNIMNPSNKKKNIEQFILIGTKCDKESARKVTRDRIGSWCRANDNMAYIETSAKEGIDIKEAFITMAEIGLKNIADKDDRKIDGTPSFTLKKEFSKQEYKTRDSGCFCC